MTREMKTAVSSGVALSGSAAATAVLFDVTVHNRGGPDFVTYAAATVIVAVSTLVWLVSFWRDLARLKERP